MKTLQHYNENFYSVVVEPTNCGHALAEFSRNIQANKPTIFNSLQCLWHRDPDTNDIVCHWTAV